ncbi:MAG: hypothetical protein JXB19_09430 [Bacteroidales bacterium]|nr:hypothetical protein [Bacteroidales bacterium]
MMTSRFSACKCFCRLYVFFAVYAIITVFVSCREEIDHDDQPQFTPVSQGTINTTLTTYSTAMDTIVHYSVYLPPGYDTTDIDYPVLYLLHGMGGDHRSWINNGMADVMNYAFHTGSARPMVVIMPQGFNAFYCNTYGLLYEDFLIDEFMPWIETNYRISTSRNNTAIAGLSMGGYGCTYHAFKRHEKFRSCYAMSAAFPGITDIPDIRDAINAKTPEELENLPEYTMEVGNQDWLVLEGNVAFDAYLKSKGIEHNYITRTGTHDWNFWMTCLPKAVAFVSSYFD